MYAVQSEEVLRREATLFAFNLVIPRVVSNALGQIKVSDAIFFLIAFMLWSQIKLPPYDFSDLWITCEESPCDRTIFNIDSLCGRKSYGRRPASAHGNIDRTMPGRALYGARPAFLEVDWAPYGARQIVHWQMKHIFTFLCVQWWFAAFLNSNQLLQDRRYYPSGNLNA